jgi:hypothetical protein
VNFIPEVIQMQKVSHRETEISIEQHRCITDYNAFKASGHIMYPTLAIVKIPRCQDALS